ncbi:hypothetical protein DBT_2334 [Dissulfuribacter thermophilus]|uniref:Uncharacterized protein n=1 Tax=Dissulfuribacter thermophilus TaxID=1156395 RepID=A0A1B9F2W2_9BACT|nr:hypothetical protein DBT_2334 [Dissulfuribacter thermophilus]
MGRFFDAYDWNDRIKISSFVVSSVFGIYLWGNLSFYCAKRRSE